MSVIPSPIIGAESTVTPDQLWALAYLLEPDWKQAIQVRTAFTTDVTAAKSDAEQRRGLLGKPIRGVQLQLRSLNQTQLLGLQNAIQRAGAARSLIPLVPDQTLLTAGESDNTLACDTRWKRFFVGGRIVIFDKLANKFTVKSITAKSDSQLTVDSPLGSVFQAGSLVYPLMETRVRLSNTTTIVTDTVMEARVDGQELPGPAALDVVAAGASTPTGFTTYQTYPILHIPIDFARSSGIKFQRTGSYSASGVTQVVTTYGERMRLGRDLPFTFFSRDKAWELISLFESRVGRLHPFWVPSPTSDYQLIAFTGSGVKVVAVGPERDWDFRPYISLVHLDGTVEIRSVSSHSRSGSEDTLVLDSPFSTPSSVARLGMAHLARFDTDEMVESWRTDTVSEVDLPVLEVVREQSVTIADLVEPAQNPMDEPFKPNTTSSYSADTPMYAYPCVAPMERPLARMADLRLPTTVLVTIKPEFTADPAFPISSGSVSAELLAALPGQYKAQYVNGFTATSRHWHHVRAAVPLVDLAFVHDSPSCTKHRFTASKTFLNAANQLRTIHVDVIAEFSNTVGQGAKGTLYHVFVYCNEVNTSYVDGTNFVPRSTTFSRNDPAVWGALTSGTGSDKWCHPQMLICASIATSWHAPCGNQGYGCGNSLVLAGFADCLAVPNGAPWVENDPDICGGNVLFGDVVGTANLRAVSLGGGCPMSDMLDMVMIENRRAEGFTALVPQRSGWDEDTGTLKLTGGSSISIDACLPSQEEVKIDCCRGHPEEPLSDAGGSPNCWRPPSSAPEACDDGLGPNPRCCFPPDSIVTLTVTQKCICTFWQFGDDLGDHCEGLNGCPDDFNISVCGTGSRTYQLRVCDMAFLAGGDPSGRYMEWDTYVRNPTYVFNHQQDNFDAVDALSWTAAQGTWTFTTGVGRCTLAGASATTPRYAKLSGATYQNGSVEMVIKTDKPQGIWVRDDETIVGGASGYGILIDPAGQTARIYRADTSTTRTLLKELTGINITAPYRLKVYFHGNNIRYELYNNDLALNMTDGVEDCEWQNPGRVGMWGEGTGTSDWDDFKVVDDDPGGYVRVSARYDANGWSFDVPEQAMPLYPAADHGCVTTGCAGAPPECNCTRTDRFLTPTSVSANQTNARVALLGEGKPYTAWGGPSGNTCVAECGLCAPFHDFVAVSMSVDKRCNKGTCPEDTFDPCVGIEYWHGMTVAEP